MLKVIRGPRALLLGAVLALGGCSGLDNGAPPVLRLRDGAIVATGEALANIRTAIATDCLSVAAPAGTDDDSKAKRNRLVTAYMFGIDLAYNEYERNLLNAVRENDLGAASASLGLSTIGSVVGDQNIARALSTANSIITGTHTAIGRDYLLNQTLTTLQTQMRSSRAAQRALLLRRLPLDYAEWNSCTALSDVLAYEQAGTLNAALAAVAASAATENRVNEARAQDAIRRVTLATNSLATALDDYLNPADDGVGAARRDAARAIIRDLNLVPDPQFGIDERYSMIVYDDDRETERQALVRALVAGDPQGTATLSRAQ